jgi:hypothetical protein
MPINRLKNRQDLYKLIKPDLTKNGNSVTFQEFIDTWFANAKTFNVNLPQTINGKIFYTNLYDFLTKAKLQNGRTFLVTYGKPNNILGNGSMTSIKTFYDAFACNDFAWAANSYCMNSEDSVDHQTADLNPYCGFFTIENNNFLKTANIRINNDGVSLVLSLSDLANNKIYDKYAKLILKHVGGGVFDVYLDDTKLDDVNNKITFNNDKSKFTFKLLSLINGTAVRKDLNTPTPTPTTTTTTTTPIKPNDDNNYRPITYDLSNIPDDEYEDDVQGNETDKYPFKLKDINDDIGDINMFYFGRRKGNMFTPALLKKLKIDGLIKDENNPVITPEMYDKIVKLFKKDVIKESVKKVLKEYINKKK